MQNTVRGTVSLYAVIWGNEDTNSKGENTRLFPQEVEDLVHARKKQLAEAGHLVEFRRVDGAPNSS